MGRTPQLATFPAVALDVSRVVENPLANAAALLAVIAQDQVLSTRALRVSNTALFGCAGRIDSPTARSSCSDFSRCAISRLRPVSVRCFAAGA